MVADQPPPTPSEGDTWLEVIKDMQERRQVGIERYGTPLQPNNGRKALVDMYQELLDAVVYLKQELLEHNDLQATFDLQWAADMRAIKLWQAAHPGNELVWPDRTNMVSWLMEQLVDVDWFCTFCNWTTPRDHPITELQEHVLTCEKHPTAKLMKVVRQAAKMGLCSQTHHEHLMRQAKETLDDVTRPAVDEYPDPA